MSRSRAVFVLTIAAAAVAILAAGCSRPPAQVTSVWPVGERERVVPQPAPALRWPYTGLDAPDAGSIRKRPLSVKIENSSAARPQVGLNSADVVYETIAEGGITRFNCIFHSKVPKTLGPVRSARLSDLWVVPQYDGLFFFSGASGSVLSKVRRADLPNLSHGVVGRPYSRASDRSAPHNLMLDTKKAYEEAAKKKHALEVDLDRLAFERRSAEATPAVTRIDIPFSQANRVRWEYDSEGDRYLRWNNGAVHKDRASGKQVRATNVVVMWAKYTVASKDMVGSVTYDIRLGGEGRATIFKNGGRYDVTWKAERSSPPKFFDAEGAPVRLARGTTWFQVIPLDGRIDMK